MAVVTPTYTLKNNLDVVVKVQGPAGSTATINLADLATTAQVVENRPGYTTPTVDIAAVTWTGHYNAVITIKRNNVVIMTLPSTGANFLNFNGQDMTADNTEHQSPFEISIADAQAELWLRLKKVAGYRSTVETEQFSVYDNPALPGE